MDWSDRYNYGTDRWLDTIRTLPGNFQGQQLHLRLFIEN